MSTQEGQEQQQGDDEDEQQPPPPDPEGVELWKQLAADDPAGKARLHELVQRYCVPWLRRQRLEPDELEDLTNDAYVSVYEYVLKGSSDTRRGPPTNLAAFLGFRARGVLTRYLRRKVRDRDKDDDVDPDVVGIDQSPDTALADAEDLKHVLSCAEELPETQRLAWRARYLDELDNEAIAERMQSRKETVAVWICRATKQIRECVGRKVGP